MSLSSTPEHGITKRAWPLLFFPTPDSSHTGGALSFLRPHPPPTTASWPPLGLGVHMLAALSTPGGRALERGPRRPQKQGWGHLDREFQIPSPLKYVLEGQNEVQALGRHVLLVPVKRHSWKRELGTLQSSHPRSKGSLAKKQPDFPSRIHGGLRSWWSQILLELKVKVKL